MAQIIKHPRVNVKVTQELINDATQEDSSHCMIAEAVKLAWPGAAHVSVDIQTIRFSDPRTRVRYVFLTPRMGQTALIRFDNGDPVEPFRMQLRNPQITPMARPKRERDAAMAAKDRTEHQEEVAQARRELLKVGRSRKQRAIDRNRAEQDAQQAKAEELYHGTSPRLKPGERASGPAGGGKGIPRLEGGRVPPAGPLHHGEGRVPASRRRQFGMRAFDKGSVLLRDGEKEAFPEPKGK